MFHMESPSIRWPFNQHKQESVDFLKSNTDKNKIQGRLAVGYKILPFHGKAEGQETIASIAFYN